MTTLSQQFEEKVRPCIDLIDRIRSLDVGEYFALPTVAVIGDQSSGKSSVLEALSGVALPRGNGIVTRCPLELTMKRNEEGEEWYGQISYKKYEADTREVEDVEIRSEDSEDVSIITDVPEYVTIEIVDPGDVEGMIREAQDKLAGKGLGISDELISLEITSPDVPDLTLIDLPGIARVALQGQDENTGEQIKGLIHKYITRQETIILVVVPCNVDIATTEALKMAREVDPDGERTLGILTKPDLVDEGTEEKVVEIVRNEVIPLKKGYMMVRCRSQQEITEKVSLTEAIEREKAFFRDHAHFQILFNEGHATVPKLAENLALKLSHRIETSLPQLEEQIEEKIEQTQAELKTYGSGPPSDEAGRLVFLIDKVTAFTQDAISLTTGEEPKCGDKFDVFSTLRGEFKKWNAHLEHAGDKFNKRIEKEVEEYEEKYRGRELPDFINYKTFEVMVKERIKQLEEPAVKRLKEIRDAVRKAFIQLANSSFFGLGNLKEKTTARIETIMHKTQSTAESMLRTQFKMELTVSSQDRINSSNLSDRKREEDGDEDKRKGTTFHKERSLVSNKDNHATLQELMLHIKSYHQVATQHLAYQIPLVIRYQMLQQSAVQLQKEMLQMIQDRRDMNTLLREESVFGSKRAALQSRLKRLMQARAHLVEF